MRNHFDTQELGGYHAETSSLLITKLSAAVVLIAIGMFVCASVSAVQAQTTAFTYQGRLNDSNVAAPTNGTYDMQFKLFDALTAGNQIGETITNAMVLVANGVFSLAADFGAASFAGADRWLQISVRPSGSSGAYTTLAPRQKITSVPYAIQSLNASQLGGVAANEYATTTSIGNSFIQNNVSGIPQTSTFNISGNGTVGGTLSGNIVNATQYNIGGIRILSADVGGVAANTFTGALAGLNNTTGIKNTFFGFGAGRNESNGALNSAFGWNSGVNTSSGFHNTFVGALAGVTITSETQNTLLGYATDVASGVSTSTAIGVGAKAMTSHTIVLGTSSEFVQLPGLSFAGIEQLCRNDGNLIAPCSSSLRYKTNVQPFTSGLSILGRLHPISFTWKQGGMRDIGLGAEDVEKVESLLTFRNAKGEIEGVKYNQLNVVLINAIKEQQAQIQTQQQEIEDLRRLVCGMRPKAKGCRRSK